MLDVDTLLISGSTRRGSTNGAVLRTVHGPAPPEPRGGRAPIRPSTPAAAREPLPEAVARLRAAIHDADALLFCTPEYAGALPGAFKNLLDWTVGDAEPPSISGN